MVDYELFVNQNPCTRVQLLRLDQSKDVEPAFSQPKSRRNDIYDDYDDDDWNRDSRRQRASRRRGREPQPQPPQPKDLLLADPGPSSKFDSAVVDRLQTALETMSAGFKADSCLLFCPADIPVYGLQSKKWAWAVIDNLGSVPWQRGTFEALQMEERKKSLLSKLVKGLSSGKLGFDDIISGRGRGLIFLLQG